jgi:predicted ATPase/DNA-binding CsgD family transcriptional regulator
MAPPNTLPLQVTPFIGREQQIVAVRAALLHPNARLLTLTGPGGTGKTRLALQAAAGLLDDFPDGVYFVGLAPVSDPELVPSEIAQALDVREVPGRELMESLCDALRPRRLLLILDNFEQVIGAAPAVADLIRAARGLRVLVTSREVLRLYGEREHPVPPLALPDRRSSPPVEHLAQFEAVQFFVDRASASRPDFTVTVENAADVAEICHRLDGLPLAIELAAARVRALSPGTMLRRMERRLPLLTGGPRDAPERQRTLRNAIAWSYDLLTPDEQALFRRLAVFRGSTLETAERVCAGEPPGPGARSVALAPLRIDVLDGLESLVEKSLLRQDQEGGQSWYVMLETVREYALERLDESAEAEVVRRRQILAAVDFAELAEVKILGPEQTVWFSRLELELDNLRAALQLCDECKYVVPALRLAAALWWFWSAHGHLREGVERLNRLLERFRDRATGPHAALYARALYAAGMLTAYGGDHERPEPLLLRSLALRRAIRDREGEYTTLEGLGYAATLRGDLDAARRYLEACVVVGRDLGGMRDGTILHALSNVICEQGDLALARSYCEEGVARLRGATDLRTFSSAVLSLALIVQEQGEFETARALASEALDNYRQAGDVRSQALALANLGSIATAAGDHAAARPHLRDSLQLQQEIGDLTGVAFVLERFVELAVVEGRHADALTLEAAASTLRQTVGAPLPSSGSRRLTHAVAVARSTLGPDEAEAASQAGRALAAEDAIAAALAPPRPPATTAAASVVTRKSDHPLAALTPREQEVAILVGRGMTNRQIATTLVIGEGTVATHVVHILNKLGYSSRAQVAVWASEHGLLLGVTAVTDAS